MLKCLVMGKVACKVLEAKVFSNSKRKSNMRLSNISTLTSKIYQNHSKEKTFYNCYSDFTKFVIIIKVSFNCNN
jgi:hypothetical protein